MMSTTMMVFSVPAGMAVKPLSSVSQRTSGSEKLSAAKAEDRKPASVMAIWMADRKLSGACIRRSSFFAFLSPSSACLRSFVSDREMTAISAAAKNALIRIRITSTIIGNSGSSMKLSTLLKYGPVGFAAYSTGKFIIYYIIFS